jgi:hypothetical protein
VRQLQARGRVIAGLLAAALVLSGLSIVPAFAAETTYHPAFIESPKYALDDHTPFGIRFSVAGGGAIPASTTLYAKVLLADTDSPATWNAANHRGFTYNEASDLWVQAGSAITSFPVFTSDGTGAVAQNWIYAKFGDETRSGTYYVHLVLMTADGANVYYPDDVPQITVLDSETQGAWLHNGSTTNAALSGKRIALRGTDSDGDGENGDPQWPNKTDPLLVPSSELYSLWELQVNVVDDDGNGLLSDEDYGPQDTNLGDYRLGAPAGIEFDVYVHRNDLLKTRNGYLVPNVTIPTADTDVSVYWPIDPIADVTAPERVMGLGASVVGGSVNLSWQQADDDVALGGYNIYRWRATSGLPYTPIPVCIATVEAGETSYSDTSGDYGVQYTYQVRAVDAATNIGPRSATVTAKPMQQQVWRFYNNRTAAHFYTSSAAEKALVLATWPTIFNYEGVAYSFDPSVNTSPLHRFYNTRTSTHFYTASDAEKASVLVKWPHIFNYEGVAYGVSTGSGVPVHRFYNVRTQTHFYTISDAEKANVLATWPDVFTYEGVGYSIGQR